MAAEAGGEVVRRLRGETVAEKLALNSIADGSGCSIWSRGRGGEGNRYGKLYLGGGRAQPVFVNVQRAALEVKLGRPLAVDAVIEASCGNKLCVESDHLSERVRVSRSDYEGLRLKLDRLSASAEDGTACRNWQGVVNRRTGYGQIDIGHRPFLAHRIALECKLGRPLRDDFNALHTCDNRRCVNPAHLWEGTQADNQADMAAKDRSVFGVRHRHAKLTDEKVREIRQDRRHSGIIAREHGVSRGTIHLVRQRRGWIRVT